jgi:peptidoglycan-associated lipoprotein
MNRRMKGPAEYHHHNKESRMRTLRSNPCLAVLLGGLLLVGAGCTKSIQANSGSKSFEPGAKRDTVTAPKTTVSNSSSKLPSKPSPSNMPTNASSSRESLASEPAMPIPSLSSLDSGPASLDSGPAPLNSGPAPLTTRKLDEERIPNELLVAKTEPSDTSRRQVEEIQREHLATAAAGLEDVFFGYDSWQISNEGKQTLMLDAEWIKANPGQKVTIEGHCDERGTLAYNLVLGEKRARSVHKYLIELGIDPNRLTVVSYGKERPFCKDREEGCYQKNRRGHIAVRVQ